MHTLVRATVVVTEVALTAAIWWSMQDEDERRLFRAGAWQLIQQLSGEAAKRLGYLAIEAERRYFEEVRS